MLPISFFRRCIMNEKNACCISCFWRAIDIFFFYLDIKTKDIQVNKRCQPKQTLLGKLEALSYIFNFISSFQSSIEKDLSQNINVSLSSSLISIKGIGLLWKSIFFYNVKHFWLSCTIKNKKRNILANMCGLMQIFQVYFLLL